MATQPIDDAQDGDDTELDEEIEQDVADTDDEPDEEGDEDGDADAGGAEAEDGEHDVVSFGGIDLRGDDEPEHISDLRRRYREQQRELEQLRQSSAPREEDAGKKPKLDDYWERDDPQGDFERDLLAWNERTRQAAARREQEQAQQRALQAEWESDLAELETQRTGLRVRDYDAAHDRVTSSLNEAQQAILVQVAKNKAALLYALGKNPDRLADLAKVTNLAKFAGEVARLDMETRVSRKPTTQPETAVRGAGSFNGKAQADAKLKKLEEQAARTGDRTALIAYRREMKAAGR